MGAITRHDGATGQQKKRSAQDLFGHSFSLSVKGRLLQSGAASLLATTAGGGAFLAVLHVRMLGALIAAGLTDFGAFAQQVLAVNRAAGNQAGGEGADVGAVAVEADAGHHHFYVGLLQAGGGTPLAGGHAGSEGVEQILMLIVHGLGE
ncbi:hypothetical protein PK28_18290 (plasmid) [Hymenobacter sp. DG25B]|nr:hypothetical protein PK28_18290 [Hymenobacter sp. DG25B]